MKARYVGLSIDGGYDLSTLSFDWLACLESSSPENQNAETCQQATENVIRILATRK